MGKGFKAKAVRAALLALTALATTAPATAQEDGGRNRGMERQGGGNNGGRFDGGQRAERPQGNPQRNWNGSERAQQPRMESPRSAPETGSRPVNRQWNGQANAPWQTRPAPPAVTPPVATPPNRENRLGNGQAGGWQNENWQRNNQPGNNGGRDRRPDVRPDSNQWKGDASRPDSGRLQVGNSWQNQNNWRSNGRLNANDRWRDQQRWSNNWRRDNRYDWSGYRQSNRSAYRLPAYRAPSGWSSGYSRFSIGLFLGAPLYSNSYWIDDPYSYRLPPAYGTLRWIRYYDDALLIDIRDGYIVDVIHSFFW